MRSGDIPKLVRTVEQITFSGKVSRQRAQEVVYITERAVFRLGDDGLVLTEIAPGVDVRRDVLERMQFAPAVPRDPTIMSTAHFTP